MTSLAKINGEMYRPTIMGRVVKLWTAHNPIDNTNYSYDFILVGKEVTAIEGFVNADDQNAENIVQQIEEGCVYEIYKYRPCKKQTIFRTVQHEVRIQLTGATMITKHENQDLAFPRHYFDFKPHQTTPFPWRYYQREQDNCRRDWPSHLDRSSQIDKPSHWTGEHKRNRR